MLGKDLIIYCGQDPIAAAKSCDVDVKSDLQEVTAPGGDGWMMYYNGRKSWSVTVNVLVVAFTEAVFHVGDTVRLSWANTGATRLTGLAVVAQCHLSGVKGRMATGSFKFTGASVIETLTNQITLSSAPFLPLDAPPVVGGNLFVWRNGTVLASAKSCDVNCSCDVIETASDTDGDFKHYIAGMKKWEITTNHLVTAIGDNMLAVGTTVRLTIGIRKKGHITADRLTGMFFIKEYKVTGSVGTLATGSFVFTGTSKPGQMSAQLDSNDPYDLLENNNDYLHSIYI